MKFNVYVYATNGPPVGPPVLVRVIEADDQDKAWEQFDEARYGAEFHHDFFWLVNDEELIAVVENEGAAPGIHRFGNLGDDQCEEEQDQ